MYIATNTKAIECHTTCGVYSDMCSVVSVTMRSEYELVSDTILGTDLHLSEGNTVRYLMWLSICVDEMTAIVPPSTVVCNCTGITIFVIVIIWSGELHPIQCMTCKLISTFSSEPSNSQWVFFTGTSYTELIVMEVGPGLVILLIIHSSPIGQSMNCLQTIPEVSCQISKAFFIVNPVLIKVLCTILPVSLYHNPSSTISGRITVDIRSTKCSCTHLVYSRRWCEGVEVTTTINSDH